VEELDEGLPFACYITYKRYCIDSKVFIVYFIGMYRILLCRMVPADSSLPDNNWIPDTVVVLGQYVTNFLS
jgi:hypothetical protein